MKGVTGAKRFGANPCTVTVDQNDANFEEKNVNDTENFEMVGNINFDIIDMTSGEQTNLSETDDPHMLSQAQTNIQAAKKSVLSRGQSKNVKKFIEDGINDCNKILNQILTVENEKKLLLKEANAIARQNLELKKEKLHLLIQQNINFLRVYEKNLEVKIDKLELKKQKLDRM